MDLDQNRLKTILERNHSFYGPDAVFRRDNRLHPGTEDFILTQFQPDMRVLDVGCGNGATLIRGNNRFAYGLGIDNDPEHIRIAEDKLDESDVANVEFRLLDFEENPEILEPESFDFVFSERGPMYNSSHNPRQPESSATGRTDIQRGDWQASQAQGVSAIQTSGGSHGNDIGTDPCRVGTKRS